MKKEEIFKYYTSDKFKPVMPELPNFRHYRFKLSNGGWRKVPDKIKTSDDLKKWIVKLGGTDIYYSTSRWLNPHRISSKGGSGTYYIADNLLLGNDLVFDIDAEEPITLKGLNEAKKSASNIYQAMKKEKRYEFQYFAFTGYKGFRLSYKDTKELPKHPRKRFDCIENDRKDFIESLYTNIKKTGYYKTKMFCDRKITVNPMCVVRVLGTAHSKTGYISTTLPRTSLRKPVKVILNHIPYIGKKRPVIPLRKMKRGDVNASQPRLEHMGEVVSGLATSPTYKYYITNKVLGIRKGFVPFFIYQKSQKYINQLKRLQEKYKLGNVHIYDFDDAKQVVAISLKTMQRRQLQKVLNESTSRTKHDFKKHRRIFAPFLMRFCEVLPAKFTGNLSRGHHHYALPDRPTDNEMFCGWNQIEFIRAVIDNG
tara:strand:+ start:8803 stop:10074 length:1272 start_codon:yes stop_codon:yes gene_type:complete